ncbi:MAG: hypothetical protein H6695_06430 [Deferribacteres bacterium]|nr:hypothetical protein [candidate division KSB1 bacterium]MCB9509799.1 hypothetical protein [Deferribacteres bacterium]
MVILKISLSLLAGLNGGWMLFDGIHVLLKGKYFGPEKPGPWSDIIAFFNLDSFKMGPLFVFLGISWLIFLAAILFGQQWGWFMGLLLCIATLWYLPVGTFISLVVLALLLMYRAQLVQ